MGVNNPVTKMKRAWADAPTLREVLKMRDGRKWSAEKIEKEMGLASGVVARLEKHVKGLWIPLQMLVQVGITGESVQW
jgi:hypothetical protein